MKKIVLFLLLLSGFKHYSQVNIKSLCTTQDTVIIGARIGEKIYSKDTVFSSKVLNEFILPKGMYALVRNGKLLGDFLVLEENESFVIEVNCDSIAHTTSEFTENFKKFVRKPDSQKVAFFQSLDQPSKKVLIWCYPQLGLLNMDEKPLKSNRDFNNFFIDYLKDAGGFLQNSPFFEINLEYYFTSLISPDYDTIIKYIPKLESNLDSSGLAYFKRWALFRFESSKVLGHENVFIDLALRHIGKTTSVYDSSTDFSIISKAKNLYPNRIGELVADFNVNIVGGGKTNLGLFEGVYKVLYFFDPDCHHCRESFPALKEFAKDYYSAGVRVYAISVGLDLDELDDFIKDFESPGEITFASDVNVSSTTFRNFYHIPSTPTIYVVQANNQCIARGIASSELSRLFEQIINN